MLMAVTQRFREIATLKCLGALEEFIATLEEIHERAAECARHVDSEQPPFDFQSCLLIVPEGAVKEWLREKLEAVPESNAGEDALAMFDKLDW